MRIMFRDYKGVRPHTQQPMPAVIGITARFVHWACLGI